MGDIHVAMLKITHISPTAFAAPWLMGMRSTARRSPPYRVNQNNRQRILILVSSR